MTIAAVIPTYNRAYCIRHAVDSALAQTLGCTEIIVVDDGSTDNTLEVLEQYKDRIRLIRQENRGVSAARNAGILAATSEWIAFLDSDDEWEPQKLAVQMGAVEADTSLVAHVSNGLVFTQNDSEPVSFFQTRERTRSVDCPQRIDHPFVWALDTVVMTPGFMARRDALIRAGLFDTQVSMFEDMDLFARVAKQGPWGICPEPLFRVYRRGQPGQSLSERSAAVKGYAARSLVYVYEKLLKLEGLSSIEKCILRRRLSAQRADLAAIDRDTGGLWQSVRGFARSVSDHPSVTSMIRALAGVAIGAKGIEWLRRLKYGERPVGLMR